MADAPVRTAPETRVAPSDARWHSLPADDVLARLETGREGLSAAEARARLERYGPNKLPEPPRETALVRFLKQFHNVLIYVLLAAAVLTAVLQEWVDTGVILAVVLVNALIGFIQEGRAEAALASIRQMLALRAVVLRDGRRVEVPAEELVPGDVVLLESGDRVPADLRVLEARNLLVEEAALTGESVPVEKSPEPAPEDAVVGDRTSLLFSGTTVAAGRARGVVVATGAATELGKIGALVAGVEKIKTPFLEKVDAFGKGLSVAILSIAALLFLFGFVFRDYPLGELFLIVVSLIVASIPEGLPAILTITLALGVQRMARRNAIIRRLPAVETLGSVTTICSDKTGTLTRNEMMAQRVVTAAARYAVAGSGYDPEGGFTRDGETGVPVEPEEAPDLLAVAHTAALVNDATFREEDGRRVLVGDPTEGALVVLAEKAGFRDPQREAPRLDEVPFESERRYMATLHEEDGRRFVAVKGAPERVLDFCTAQATPEGAQPLDRAFWEREADALADEGYRVLAIARRGAETDTLAPEDAERDLTLLGLVGLIDPPREEAKRAVKACQEAGIRVKMITGDHALTARSIGAQLGIGDGVHVVTGRELEEMDLPALRKAVASTDVFARTSPEHKLRLVEALQAEGEVAAMTGDGVNDAPALKRADVGVAMGITGTEAAKDAAEMVLADDNFATIAHAVEEGRTVYDNLKKTILFILPTNGAEALVVLASVVFAFAIIPITPVQILWVNMVTAVTLALAFAFEPAAPDVMKRPPRARTEPIISAYLVWRIAFVSMVAAALTLLLFFFELEQGLSEERARTVAVNALVASQLFYLFNTRYIKESSLRLETLTGNRAALVAVVVLLGLQALFTYAPFMQLWFGTEGLLPVDWLWVLGVGAAVFVVVEIEKAIMRAVRKDR